MNQRIVSLAPSNTEILFALEKQNEIVGVTAYCDYPAEALQKTRVGSWTKVNFEKIKSLSPTLCVTSTFLQDKIVQELQEMGLLVFHSDPKNLEEVLESIHALGKQVDASKKAYALVKNIRNELKQINSLQKNESVLPKMFVLEWHQPLTVSCNWVPDIVQLAGAEPVLAAA